MIIVLFARTKEALRSIYGYAMDEHKGLLDYVNLATMDSALAREKYLQSVGDPYGEGRVTFVFNPTSWQELKLLRERQAVICHQYGALMPIYSEISIARGDLMFTDTSNTRGMPGHVLTPDEVLSECKIKHRRNRTSVKKAR
ncbi:hypothetical protein [Pseudoalteromonas rhizosphaerae]|uniref:hypothetical protein n=1 Tax=Pseudoalteromonas rhizosphaerae TaxID=2518973 RepID=UPI001230F466|nr:hypothetical protein [Pseudoalteromonas rhizosphaerae]